MGELLLAHLSNSSGENMANFKIVESIRANGKVYFAGDEARLVKDGVSFSGADLQRLSEKRVIEMLSPKPTAVPTVSTVKEPKQKADADKKGNEGPTGKPEASGKNAGSQTGEPGKETDTNGGDEALTENKAK